MKKILFAALMGWLLTATSPVAFAWGAPIGSAQFNPAGINLYVGPNAFGYGAYKYGYGDYSDRFGYQPIAPGNYNASPAYPSVGYGFQTITPPAPPPTTFPLTTYGGYGGGFRTGSVGDILLAPGVNRNPNR